MPRRHAVIVAASLLLATPGCEREHPLGITGPAGTYRLEVDRSPFGLRLIGPGGRTLTSVAPGGLGIGRVAAWSPQINYNPYLMVYDFMNEPAPPDGLTWIPVTAVTSHAADGAVHQLGVRLADGTAATLRITGEREGVFSLALAVPDATAEVEGEPAVVYTYLDLRAPSGEEYYGLGEVFGAIGHRGQQVALQKELFPTESYNNEAHVRVPLLVSTGGWGVFAETMRPGYFDVAATEAEVVRLVLYDPAVPLHLLAAADPLAITSHYTALTGQPAIPPPWAFAPIQWRNEIAGQTEVLADASAIREHGIPTGALWLDRPWERIVNDLQYDPARYPDATAMVAALHRAGFRLAAWSSPYLHEDDPAWAAADAAGWFPQGTFPFGDFGDFMDLTHPDAMAFWQARVQAGIDRGLEGFKLDYAEDVQLGLSYQRMPFTFANGEDERTMHAHYATYYHRAYAVPLGLPELFIIARAGTVGGQTQASVIWPGDLCSGFEDFLEEDDEGTVHVGGLPAAVRAGLGLSVAGYPFFASDTGGFRHARPTKEVMIRWTQYAALLPIMQYGGGGANHNPWDFTAYGASQFDTETLDVFREYAVLHTRLFPYFYTLARQAHETGYPVIRPFGLAYPEDGRHPDDAFLSGPDLLVAPLVRGGSQRTVPIPPGRWIDWWTGEVVAGPTDLTVAAPLGVLPLYLRAGGLVPLLRPGVETLSPVDDPGVDSWASDPGRLHGRLALPDGGTATLGLHDGAELTLSADGVGGGLLTFAPGTGYAGIRFEVHAPDVTAVEHDGVPLAEVTSEGALDACDGCWYRAAGSPWVIVAHPAAGSASLAFTLQ